MHLIEVTPGPCLVCGAGNTPGRDGRRQFVDLEVDVNWNDPGVICEDCGLKIGALLNMLSPDSVQGMKKEVQDAQAEVHRVTAQMDTMRRRAKKIGIAFEEVAA